MLKQQNNKVLVLEDESDAGLLISSVIKSLGFEPQWVNSIKEAKKALDHEASYRFLFLDYHLPDGISTELIENKKIVNDTPIVLCSAYLDDIKKTQSISHPYFSLLDKPVNKEKIKSVLRTLQLID